MTDQTEAAMPASVPMTPLVICAPETPTPPPYPEERVVPAIPLVMGGIPKPPADAAGAENAVVLSFPTDSSLGMLVVTKMGENPSYYAAQGDVSVPAGWNVQFNVDDKVTDASVLSGLDPHAIRVMTATGLDDAGLAGLAGFKALVYLRLGSAVTDAGLAHLVAMSSLTSLTVESEHITDAAATQISRLTSLMTVHLAPCRLSDAGIAELAKLPNLTGLGVRSPLLTNDAVKALARCPVLEHLTLTSDGLDDRGLPALTEGFAALKEATIRGAGVTTEGVMATFARGLQAELNGQWFSPKAVERLARKASAN